MKCRKAYAIIPVGENDRSAHVAQQKAPEVATPGLFACHNEPCRIPHKPCSIGVLCRAYKGGNPYQSSFTADTGTYRLCADKVVCKRVYEVERILLN